MNALTKLIRQERKMMAWSKTNKVARTIPRNPAATFIYQGMTETCFNGGLNSTFPGGGKKSKKCYALPGRYK